MTDKKTLSVMTVDEFRKHMASELAKLAEKHDEDRSASLRKSLDVYNTIDASDEHARIPVELYKSDPDSKYQELSEKIDELSKQMSEVLKKVGEPEENQDDLSDEEKKKAEEAKKTADEEAAKKVEEEEAAKKKEEEKAAAELAAKNAEPVDWDSDMGHKVLSAPETIAKKKE